MIGTGTSETAQKLLSEYENKHHNVFTFASTGGYDPHKTRSRSSIEDIKRDMDCFRFVGPRNELKSKLLVYFDKPTTSEHEFWVEPIYEEVSGIEFTPDALQVRDDQGSRWIYWQNYDNIEELRIERTGISWKLHKQIGAYQKMQALLRGQEEA